MNKREMWNLITRYLVLLILGLFQLRAFYLAFTPATVYPVYYILELFDRNSELLIGNILFFKGIYVEIIQACIAGAAYYLLFILNLTTSMKAEQRAKSLVFLVGSFLILNIIRILLFSYLAVSGGTYFDAAHNFIWYFGSTIMVVVLWFVNVSLFKIKNIPIYSDFYNLFKDIKKKRRK